MTAPATPWRLADADWNSWPGGLSDVQVRRQAADLGLDGIEVGVYDAAVELAPQRVQALAAGSAAPVLAVLLSLPAQRWPGGALSGDLHRLLDQVRACAAVCAALGLDVLGLWPGADPAGRDVTEALRRCVDAAGGVRLAVEPKPGTVVATAREAAALCEQVEGVGVLLDTGHSWAGGDDPAQDVALLGDRLLHCHLGDAATGGDDDDLPCGRLHDFGPVVASLRTASFRGTATFDLYGAVTTGGLTSLEAVRESCDHLRAAG